MLRDEVSTAERNSQRRTLRRIWLRDVVRTFVLEHFYVALEDNWSGRAGPKGHLVRRSNVAPKGGSSTVAWRSGWLGAVGGSAHMLGFRSGSGS
jgi:hypothetical protein